MDVALIIAAFGFGFLARAVRLPPLVGYLAAGFVLHAAGYESTSGIDVVADLGVLLLLFSIGLKLNPSTLARREVWGTALGFAVVGIAVAAGLLLASGSLGLPLASDLPPGGALVVGFALSFSSTVFAVKTLEEKNEGGSLAGRIAIGVLVLQDIFAVGFLVVASGEVPSPWAIAIVPGFYLARPVFGWLLERSGHGEVLVLLGFVMAVGVGAESFALVGLKPDLGALVAGLLLSRHPRAGEMADRMLSFKDLFLVGFFLSIGLGGMPPVEGWVIAGLALAVIPARTVGLFWLHTRFRLRARTSLHSSLTLASYSEFGLIVAAAALAEGMLDQAWVSTIGVAVAGSFVLAASTNAFRYRLYEIGYPVLHRLEREPIIDEDAVLDCGTARILVFGMGRVGTGTYDELVSAGHATVVAVDRVAATVEQHRAEGRNVIRGDALDRDFWERVRFHPEVDLVFAVMNNHQANLECVRRIRRYLPNTRIASIATFPDQVRELREAGVDVARNLYEEAGQALADDAMSET